MKVLRPPPFEDEWAYWELLRAAWQAGEPFAVIEPDVQSDESVIARFESCLEPWCFNSYPVPADAHAYEPVDARCQIEDCGRLEHDHPSFPEAPGYVAHKFTPTDLSCRDCGQAEHAPTVGMEIADLGGFALGCSRFRPADLPDVFAHEMLAWRVHWANLDVHMTTALRLLGLPAAHRHLPDLVHTKKATRGAE